MRKSVLFITIICYFFISRIDAQEVIKKTFYFESGNETLQGNMLTTFQSFVKTTNFAGINFISITVYCDDIGTTAFNKNLSYKRAKEIEKYFPAKTEIRLFGKGEVAVNSSDTAEKEKERAQNRRVEIEVNYSLKTINNTLNSATNTDINFVHAVTNKKLKIDEMKVGDKITLENILFVGGRKDFLEESFAALEELTKTLKEKNNYHILILGHVCCEPTGNDGIDFETGLRNLSEKRAEAVYSYLIEHGIASSRLAFKGMKGTSPTGLGDKFDRRVELQITNVVK